MRSVMSLNARRVSVVIVCLCCVSAAASSQEEAIELHHYNASADRSSEQAMWSQVEIVYDHIRRHDWEGAQTAQSEMLARFSQQPTLPKEIGQVADAYLQAGQYEQAQALCRYGLMTYPDCQWWGDFAVIQIKAHLATDAVDLANASLESLWTVHAERDGAVELLAAIKSEYWRQGYRQESQALCERIYSAYPDSPLAAVVLADHIRGSIVLNDMESVRRGMDTLCTQHGDHERAVELLAAIKTEYWLQGYRQASQALCEQIVAAYPDDPATAAVLSDYLCGRIAMGQEADAWQDVEAFWSRYQSHPDFFDMAHRIAHHYQYSSRDIGRALELNQRLVKLFPTDEKTIASRRDIIMLYLDMGAKEMADMQLEQLPATYADHPSLALVLNGLGEAYRKHGHHADSIRIHQAVLALRPTETEQLCAYAGMAKAQIQKDTFIFDPNEIDLARRQEICPELIIEQLIADYATAPRTGFHVFQIAEEYYFRGEHLMKTGQPEAGKLAFETAIRLWKHNKALPDRHHAAMAAYFSGVASGYLGDAFSAMGYYQEVARNYPEYDKAWHARFMVAECAGRLSASNLMRHADAVAMQLTAYQEILDNDPNSPVDSIARQRVQMLSK